MFDKITILRPMLPSAERLMPYLAAVDEARIYSNFGPLTRAFEERLATHFGLAEKMMTTVANGTLGLTLALMAQAPPAGSLCIMPSWTFVASVNAAVLAGLTPYFVDVDPYTWSLDPETIEEELGRAPAPVGAVMVVAPFGRPIDYVAWDSFKARTGLAVVIDAAAAFDTLSVGQVPAVVSLHATKVFGVGEGGLVACRDTSITRAVRQSSNFGFAGSRTAAIAGMNAKLSEYHAAVGLAALDVWRETRAAWMKVASVYRQALGSSNHIGLQPGFGERWVSSTCIVCVDEVRSAGMQQALANAGIETRMWWGRGAHDQPVAADFPRTRLPVTERLARSTFGVPLHQDMDLKEIEHVASALIAAAAA